MQYTNPEIIISITSRRKSPLKKILLGLLITLMILILGTFIAIPPLITKDMVNLHVNFSKTYSAKDFGITADPLTLTTSDGIRIAAQEVKTENPKAVVIFISGIHNPSVTAFFDHARLLKENGYASILYDMRSHGKSEGKLISLGFKEYLDTKAVVDYIRSSPGYKDVPIVVFGLSMGAATAINSIGEISEIDGLISISAYSSWEDVFCDNMANMGMPKAVSLLQKPFVKLYLGFKYGFDKLAISPKNEIKRLGNRPALILHTKGDSEVPFESYKRIMKNAPKQVETWTRDGDGHFFVKDGSLEDLSVDPEYTAKILEFLNKHFGKK